ncbi:MAG: sulfopyruvate decarboxylase subunit beta [Deltaproteobacteria bacterium]|nr:sulfopyruvate decarboxylase subunit beta [Deltaproteobacteria bacterium]
MLVAYEMVIPPSPQYITLRPVYHHHEMGLAPSVGLGVALAHPERKVVVIEGDGSIAMGLSSLVTIAHNQPDNLMIVCMDNQIYEAGGQNPTPNAGRMDFVKTMEGLGITPARSVDSPDELRRTASEFLSHRGCSFLHVPIGKRKGPLHQPTLKPYEMKHRFRSLFT